MVFLVAACVATREPIIVTLDQYNNDIIALVVI